MKILRKEIDIGSGVRLSVIEVDSGKLHYVYVSPAGTYAPPNIVVVVDGG